MKTSLLKKIIPFLIILFSCAVTWAYEIDINADSLEYDQIHNKISASGNVKLVWEGKTVTADYAEFLIEEKIMEAYGNVKIDEAGNAFFANSVKYYYDAEKGEIRETMALSSAIFMRARSMERQDGNTYAVNNIKISNCDLDNPHTYFKAKRGKITLGERVTIYNPVLYIGKIPVFYLPIVTKSLKGGKGVSSRLKFNIEPGYTNEGGISVKSSVEYAFSDTFKGTGMLDYYGSRGWGYGAELNLFTDNAKASIYAYNINDLSIGQERWTVRPYYWHRLNDKWTIQSQAEFISDRDFNNMYRQGDWDRVMNTLHSYASVTRQGTGSNLMILAQRYDVYDSYTDDYETNYITLPEVNFTYYPKKIFWGITNSFNMLYTNRYQEYSYDNFFYKNTLSATYSLTKDFRFGRKFTLKPTIGLTEDWYDRNNYDEWDSSFVTRYFASLNSRLRVNRWMDWNLNYSFKARTEENRFSIEDSANDYGIETNLLSFTNYMYIGSRTTVRNFVSYSFRNFKTDTGTSNWSPFITELTLTPKHYITAYIRQTQLLEPFKFQSMQIDARIGEMEKIYFNFGAFYQDYRSEEIDNTIGFGLWVTPKWQLEYNITTTAKIDGSYIRMNEHQLRVYRDLHCYNVGVTWRIRGVYHEVFFKFDLKTNMPFARRAQEESLRQEEEIFYPWR